MRPLKIIATLAGGLLAAVVVAYLALLFINRHDQPPSPEALRFEALYRDRPPVADVDNGYLYALDFPQSGGLFEPYRVLLSHAGWRRPQPFAMSDRLPAFAKIRAGQEALMLRAQALADRGDVAGVRELLGEDARFWRMVLESSDILIDKMIAVASLNRHFALGNLVLRRLPAAPMPPEWAQEIKPSMTRCLVGEWEFISGSLRKTYANEPGIYRPLFQPQDTSNKLAAMLARTAHELDVPFSQYPQVLRGMRAQTNHAPEELGPLADLYNLIGSMITNVPDNYDYGKYAARVADVEGVRRAVVLAATLRGRGVAADDVPAQLAASEIRNPYTNGPFAWDLKEKAIVFTGLEAGERGRHDFRY
jgi:hypothetical protein